LVLISAAADSTQLFRCADGYRSAAMALLRRRKREQAQEPQPPAAGAAGASAGAESPDAWTPAGLSRAPDGGATSAGDWVPAQANPAEPAGAVPAPDAARAGEWLPPGVTAQPRQRRPSRPANPARPPDAPPAVEGSAEAPAADAELRLRLDALEQRIAAAQRDAADAERERQGRPASAEEAAGTATSYDELQRSVAGLRSRLDRESGTQRETIGSLEARLAEFEEQLRHPAGSRPPAARTATALRLLLMIAVFVVIAGAPLFTTRRTTCNAHLKKQVSWTFVKPFDNGGPPNCKNELGGTVVLDALGLR
jgi:hypothetical protein